MPTFSTTNHNLQFGNSTPTVSIYGTDTDGYIVYDMSPSGSFYQFAPNTKYFALEVIFDTPFVLPPGVSLSPANAITAALVTASPAIEFFVDQSAANGFTVAGPDVTTSYFRISGISTATPTLGPEVLMWSYSISGQQVGVGSGGTVTSVATNSTLTGGPITTSGTLGLNLAHSNSWTTTQNFTNITLSDNSNQALIAGKVTLNFGVATQTISFPGAGGSLTIPYLENAQTFSATQTFSSHVVLDGYTLDLSAGATSGQVLKYDGVSFKAGTVSGGGATGPKALTLAAPLNSILGTASIAGANQFSPGDYSGYTTISFHAVYSNGNSSVSTSVTLHDATNNVDIYTTTYSGSTAYQVVNQTLTIGTPGTNLISGSPAIYEVRILVNTPVTGGTNFIQLYSAEMRVA